MKRFLAGAVLLLGFGLSAQSVGSQTTAVIPLQRDQILKATYCLEVVANEAKLVAKIIQALPPEVRSDPKIIAHSKMQQDNVERLMLYLSPDNTKGVSPGDQLSATTRAKSDLAEINHLPDCGTVGTAAFQACDDNLMATYPALARVRRCNDLSWLPF
jgi:hypothetical protein